MKKNSNGCANNIVMQSKINCNWKDSRKKIGLENFTLYAVHLYRVLIVICYIYSISALAVLAEITFKTYLNPA